MKLFALICSAVIISSPLPMGNSYMKTPPMPKVEPVKEVALTVEDHKQIKCLAANMYYEARGETVEGAIAVGNVVMNRVEDGRFPETPCEVVAQRSKKGCQFSWMCSKKKKTAQLTTPKLVELAEKVYKNEVPDVTGGATFYHASYVRPYWRKYFSKTKVIGKHIFYARSS